MSYRIEYQWCAFRVDGAATGLGEDRFIVAIEGGDNNVVDTKSGRRARSWDVCMIGTASQVLKQAVLFSSSCESGCLKLNGRDTTPESYIRRIRQLINGPSYQTTGWWIPKIDVPPSHPLLNEVQAAGLTPVMETCYGTQRARLTVPKENLAEYFVWIGRYPDISAWNWASVGGLAAS